MTNVTRKLHSQGNFWSRSTKVQSRLVIWNATKWTEITETKTDDTFKENLDIKFTRRRAIQHMNKTLAWKDIFK